MANAGRQDAASSTDVVHLAPAPALKMDDRSTPGAAKSSTSTNSTKSKRITDIIAASNGKPIFSLEFFPPKTQQGLSNLYARIGRMVNDLDPAWVQITWGAGGSTQSTSLDLAGRVQHGALGPKAALEKAIRSSNSRDEGGTVSRSAFAQSTDGLARNVCLHLTCTNVEKASLDQTLDRAYVLGIRNILALRGDPPRGQEYWVAADERFQHATDLVKYIRQRHGNDFCIGVAAYPDMHPDADSSNAMTEAPQDSTTSRADSVAEMQHLLAKQEAGADFIVTQLFYDVDNFLVWHRSCRAHGITIPIIPGVMPIQSYQTFRRVTSLCRAKVPTAVWDAVEPVRFDDAAVRDVGVQQTKAMIQRICEETDIRGFHMCTLNLEKSVKTVLQGLQWVARDEQPFLSTSPQGRNGQTHANGGAATTKLDVSRPEETAATWDEFPNGRYGDARSPAFGQIDGYGVSLKIAPHDALRQWGHPANTDDLSDVFVRYLQGELEVIPWCDCPILPETNSIQRELLRLNARPERVLQLDDGEAEAALTGKGWWTVGSQPSADGIDSSDPVFGFGPAHGYIFQKAFVEFFIGAGDMLMLEERIHAYNAERGGSCLSYFAGNRAGELRTNVKASDGESCAVTWGCFVGKEIVQTTIIEEESFKAWRDEAFAIWSEWELLFPPKSPTQQLLRAIGEQRWLVTVIHHDYKDESALWKFLGVR